MGSQPVRSGRGANVAAMLGIEAWGARPQALAWISCLVHVSSYRLLFALLIAERGFDPRTFGL